MKHGSKYFFYRLTWKAKVLKRRVVGEVLAAGLVPGDGLEQIVNIDHRGWFQVRMFQFVLNMSAGKISSVPR